MKTIFSSLLTLVALSAAAQVPGTFKLSGAVGYAQPIASGITGGIAVALEPKVTVTNKVDVGVRFEGAYITRGVQVNSVANPSSYGLLMSYLATGTYRLSEGRIKTYAGAGAGIFQVANTNTVTVIYDQSPNDVKFPGETRFGGMARLGLKTGHYIANLEYNAVLPSKVYLSATALDARSSYLSLKIGYEIGGYKK